MELEIIRKEEQYTTKWSGGITTELYLFPKEADYKKRNFIFRISTAVCREKTSVFTKLEDTERILLVLAGKLSLFHKPKKHLILLPGEQDRFAGSDDTCSEGYCIDFNLMLKEKSQGKIYALYLPAGDSFLGSLQTEFTGVYLYTGCIDLITEANDILYQNDFGMIRQDKIGESFKITAKEDSYLVISYIKASKEKEEWK